MISFLKNILYRFFYAIRNILDPFLHFQEVSILAYHSISDERIDTAVSRGDFDRQIEYLKRKGFSFVSLAALQAWLEGKAVHMHKAVAITFDDGYADFETQALPVLEKHAVPVTLFMIGNVSTAEDIVHENLKNKIPLLSAEALERVRRNSLVEIGFHSATHANLAKLSGDALAAEMTSPFPAKFFAYPGGNYSDAAIAEAKALGYAAAFSIKRRLVSKKANRYLLPRTVVTRTMKPWLVGVHVTKAIDWYRAATSVLK